VPTLPAVRGASKVVSRPGTLPVASGSRHGGLGLGLRIVRHMVREHGGEFVITSKVGVGTSASFTVPLAPAAPADF
jgi:signal transduction histidine kinase